MLGRVLRKAPHLSNADHDYWLSVLMSCGNQWFVCQSISGGYWKSSKHPSQLGKPSSSAQWSQGGYGLPAHNSECGYSFLEQIEYLIWIESWSVHPHPNHYLTRALMQDLHSCFRCPRELSNSPFFSWQGSCLRNAQQSFQHQV